PDPSRAQPELSVPEPIAVIGMSGRFAKSSTLADLWTHLASGDDLTERVDRWDLRRAYADDSQDPDGACYAGGLPGAIARSAVAGDTACSSSLVAMHMACEALRTKKIRCAIAGGVFVLSTPDFYVAANRAGMLSPEGRCYTFDARADGFVPGEGVGAVVLKRL